jgi:hypothetical protein
MEYIITTTSRMTMNPIQTDDFNKAEAPSAGGGTHVTGGCPNSLCSGTVLGGLILPGRGTYSMGTSVRNFIAG